MRYSERRATERGGVLAGCLIALGVVAVLVVIGVIVVAMNWRSWTGKGIHAVMEAAVTESSLPEAEKTEVMAVVDGFTADFEAGDVTAEQFGNVLKELTQSPIMPAMIVAGVQADYIAPSSLTEEEKAEGRKDLSRFVRGVHEGTIPQTKIDDVSAPLHAPLGASNKRSIHVGNLNIELKDPKDVTPEELRLFLANANAEADAAAVPDEQIEIDWSLELQKAIDKAMGRAPVEAPVEGGAGGG